MGRRKGLAAVVLLVALLLAAARILPLGGRQQALRRQAQETRTFRVTLAAIPTATPTPPLVLRQAEVATELAALVSQLEAEVPGWNVLWADLLSQQVAVAAVPPQVERAEELLPGLEVLWQGSQPFFRKVRGGEDLDRSETEVGTVTVFLLREHPRTDALAEAYLMIAMNQFYVYRYLNGMDVKRPVWDRGQYLQHFERPLLLDGIDWRAVQILLPARVFPTWSHYPDLE